MKDIKVLSFDDWTGFYVDGQLIRQGHSFNAFEVMEMLGIAYERIRYDDDISKLQSVCPETLAELDELIEEKNIKVIRSESQVS